MRLSKVAPVLLCSFGGRHVAGSLRAVSFALLTAIFLTLTPTRRLRMMARTPILIVASIPISLFERAI